jgi:hypothetical protein
MRTSSERAGARTLQAGIGIDGVDALAEPDLELEEVARVAHPRAGEAAERVELDAGAVRVEGVRLGDAPAEDLPAGEVTEVAHVRVCEEERGLGGGERVQVRGVSGQGRRRRGEEGGVDGVRRPLYFRYAEERGNVRR